MEIETRLRCMSLDFDSRQAVFNLDSVDGNREIREIRLAMTFSKSKLQLYQIGKMYSFKFNCFSAD